MIHVTSDIGAVRSSVIAFSKQLHSSAVSVRDAGKKYGAVNKSADTEVTSKKINAVGLKIDLSCNAVLEFGACLAFAQRRYKECQEKAIARSNHIPS